MRAEGALRLVAVATLVSCSLPTVGFAVVQTGGAADSASVLPARTTAADSARGFSAGDSARVVLPADSASAGPKPGAPIAPPIDLVAERKFGAASLEDALRMRRAVFVSVLPLFGPTQGSLALPDGGGPLGLDGWILGSERATDEPLVGSVELGWGTPWLAFSLSDPRADGMETLDLDAIEFPSERARFRGPGEVLARPTPKGPPFARAPADTARTTRSKTTLVYRRGSGDAQLSGIRFQARAFRRDLYASFTRNQAHGWAPLRETVSVRYALSAELGRLGRRRFDLEGLLYERTIRDSVAGESEWDGRHVAIRAARTGARWSDAWRIRAGTGKETWVLAPDAVSPDAGSRERWKFPTVALEGAFSWRADSALTWVASIGAASRTIVYRIDSEPEFEPRREEARIHLGSRYQLAPRVGVGVDAAYDVRERGEGFWDARGSLWGGTERLHGRVDVESAHQRPSWVDLLTPPRLLTFISTSFVPTELFRSGDPGLKPRRLTGALGSVGLTPLPGLALDFSGSYRRVTDDFGWDVTSDTTGGTLRVSSVAGARRSGWLSHAAFGWELRRGPLRARGMGWVRGGPDSLSPQGGSPPRRAVDAALELRVVLFQGDLPLRFGVESHARGPRRGLIREAGQITWDGSLATDFGTAGVFVLVRDVFDRRPGSAIWDPTLPSGAPLPGRTFQVGVAWNLLD
jgi:hypothetical protein